MTFIPREYQLTPSETVLSDESPVYLEYIYIADGVFVRCPLWDSTVADWKRVDGIKEIRRCDLFLHTDARLGDKVG